jgi:hypothetical protein
VFGDGGVCGVNVEFLILGENAFKVSPSLLDVFIENVDDLVCVGVWCEKVPDISRELSVVGVLEGDVVLDLWVEHCVFVVVCLNEVYRVIC